MIVDKRVVNLPEFLFLFWKAFQKGEDIDVARKSFTEKTIFDDEVFDESIELLISEGVIIPYG